MSDIQGLSLDDLLLAAGSSSEDASARAAVKQDVVDAIKSKYGIVDGQILGSGKIIPSSSDDPWESLAKIWDKQAAAADLSWERSQSSAREAMDFERDEAQKARDWQIFARQTYYRDMMQSLKDAGLNPALAIYNSMGYSTPQASASASGRQASASKASVSTENVSMEMIQLVVQALAGLASSALKILK